MGRRCGSRLKVEEPALVNKRTHCDDCDAPVEINSETLAPRLRAGPGAAIQGTPQPPVRVSIPKRNTELVLTRNPDHDKFFAVLAYLLGSSLAMTGVQGLLGGHVVAGLLHLLLACFIVGGTWRNRAEETLRVRDGALYQLRRGHVTAPSLPITSIARIETRRICVRQPWALRTVQEQALAVSASDGRTLLIGSKLDLEPDALEWVAGWLRKKISDGTASGGPHG
jgi:hypothetical protein